MISGEPLHRDRAISAALAAGWSENEKPAILNEYGNTK